MTDNIIEILRNVRSISDVITGNNYFDCIIRSENNNSMNEYTITLDNSGITIKNNLSGVISRRQQYDIRIIDLIINNADILENYNYNEEYDIDIDIDDLINEYDEFYNDYISGEYKLNLLNATFKYMGEKCSDDFIRRCNLGGLINKGNYFYLLVNVCEAGNVKLFKYFMLSYLEYFNNLDNTEKTTLTGSVCFGGNTEIVRILLQDKRFIFGFEALKGAIQGRNFNIFEHLIRDSIVDINSKNRRGETIIFDAIKSGYISELIINKPETINILLDNRDSDKEKIKPIIAEYLLSWPQLNMNIRSRPGETILHLAAQNKNSEIIKFLFKRRPEIYGSLNEKDNNDLTPLHLAADNKNPEIIRFLLGLPGIEGSLNEASAEDWTPLHFAADNENTEIIRILLEKPGIEESLNHRDIYGETPLGIARISRNLKTIKLLLAQENIEIENEQIGELRRNFNNDVEIMALLNNYLARTRSIVLNNVIGNLSNTEKQLDDKPKGI